MNPNIIDLTVEVIDLTEKKTVNRECDICYTSIEKSDDTLTLKCCKYTKDICLKCAQKWFEESENDSCPFCKANI